ncbi:MAG TPA: signal peptide peptidase SppA, partial [Mucilaginibacter sp.]
MKEFFKFVFASMVGFLLTSIVIFILIFLVIAGLVAISSDKTVEVEPNSVLQISLNYPITERTPNNPLSALSFLGIDGDKSTGLNDILANIKKAETDPD